MASDRVTSHYIPQEERNAMERFYHSKRCVIEKKLGGVKWAHMLDAALDTSNDRVRQILTCLYNADDEQTAGRNASTQAA
jgi:hypothetical protein